MLSLTVRSQNEPLPLDVYRGVTLLSDSTVLMAYGQYVDLASRFVSVGATLREAQWMADEYYKDVLRKAEIIGVLMQKDTLDAATIDGLFERFWNEKGRADDLQDWKARNKAWALIGKVGTILIAAGTLVIIIIVGKEAITEQ